MTTTWAFAAALLVLASAFVVGCSLVRESHPGIVDRLIREDPERLFQTSELLMSEPLHEWVFLVPEDLVTWQDLGRHEPLRIANGQLRLPAGDRPSRLVREAALDAETIDAIEVTLTGLRRGVMKFYWAGEGQEFSPERSVELRPELGVNSHEEMTYRLAVGLHPMWQGRIARVRLDPSVPGNEVVQLRSIRTVEFELPEARLAELLSRPWKVELGSEARSALLAPPGVPVEWSVDVPHGGLLRLGFGVQPGVREPVEFLVAAHTPRGDVELLRRTVAPGGTEVAGWNDAEIDLEGVAGRTIRLSLRTSCDTQLDLVRGFPVWANPEVTGPVRGATPVNVVLISLDTLRADRLSLYGHDRETSPELNSWASRRAVVFDNAVAPSPWTLPSHVTMFTGLHPFRHGVNHNGPAPASLTMLAEMLRERGYSTGAITGGLYLRPQEGFVQGFDTFEYWHGGGRDREISHGVDTALSWIERRQDLPFFLFFHTYEVHSPYVAREPYFTRFTQGQWEPPFDDVLTASEQRVEDDGYKLRKRFVTKGSADAKLGEGAPDIEMIRALYDSGVAYADEQVGRLLGYLEESGLAERTLVIVTSDHGEALGEKGLAAHAYLYDFNLMVPMVVGFPEARWAGRRVPAQVASVDIVPTVLEVVDGERPQHLDGSSMIELLGDDPVAGAREAWSYAASSNFGLSLRVSNRIKYIFNNTGWSRVNGEDELYHLQDDPAEAHDASQEDPAAERLRVRSQEVFAEATGLWLEFGAGSNSPLHGTVEASRVDPSWIKAAQINGADVEWHKPGTVEFSVPTGGRLELMIETLAGRTLELVARSEGGSPPLRLELAPEALDGAVLRSESSNGWRDEPVGARSAWVRVEWRGARGMLRQTEATEGIDPQLLEQLRALGYVD